MEFTDEERKIQDEAVKFIETNNDRLIEQFILSKKPLPIAVFSIFMAGSPGAGKTEFAKNYMPAQLNKADQDLQKILAERKIDINSVEQLFIRIDVDEIRSFLPQYQKTDTATGVKANAHIIQKAANKGLDILRGYCLDHEFSFLHDGTFGNYDTMRKIIKKSIAKGRVVHIYYIYLDPLSAWEFTKAREYIEGRNIVKEKFIEQFCNSKENVDKIKAEFGEKVRLHCILKNSKNQVEEVVLDQASVANVLEVKYTKGLLKRYPKEDLSNLLT